MKTRMYFFATALCALIFSCARNEKNFCITDEHCFANQRCIQKLCRENIECTHDSECDNPKDYCNLTNYQCELRKEFGKECDNQDDCELFSFCSILLEKCLPIENSKPCDLSTQCPEHQICDRFAHQCIADIGCFGTEFCDPQEICDIPRHVCLPSFTECAYCIDDTQCGQKEICDTKILACTKENQLSPCPISFTCDQNNRCVECHNDKDCAQGLYCNLSLNICESKSFCITEEEVCPNIKDIDCHVCASPKFCNPDSRTCELKEDQCQSDTDCAPLEFCNTQYFYKRCEPVITFCPDDSIPSNHEYKLRYTLPIITDEKRTLNFDFMLCPFSEDWYELNTDSGYRYVIDLSFDNKQSDLDVVVYERDGYTPIAVSDSSTGYERIVYHSGISNSVIVKIYHKRQLAKRSDYHLTIYRFEEFKCIDDSDEENDQKSDATVLLSTNDYQSTVCSGDPDWYSLPSLSPGNTILITLSHLHTLGNLNIFLHDDVSPYPLFATHTSEDTKVISWQVLDSSPLYIRVSGEMGDSNNYHLSLSIDSLSSACIPEAEEPNSSPYYAPKIQILDNKVIEASLCQNDEDWYEINLKPNDVLYAKLDSSYPQGDIDLKLVSSNAITRFGKTLAASLSSDNTEFISYFSDAEQKVYLVAIAQKGYNQKYSLSVYKQIFAAIDCAALTASPNPIMIAKQKNLLSSLCPAQSISYEYQAPALERIKSHLVFPSQKGMMSIQAKVTESNHIFTSTITSVTLGYAVTLEQKGPAAFDFVITNISKSETVPYLFFIESLPIFHCDNEMIEPNDTYEQTAILALDNVTSGALCEKLSVIPESSITEDIDMYVASFSQNSRYLLSYSAEPHGISIEIIDPFDKFVICSNQDNTLCTTTLSGFLGTIDFVSPKNSAYYVKISSQKKNFEETRYNLQVSKKL